MDVSWETALKWTKIGRPESRSGGYTTDTPKRGRETKEMRRFLMAVFGAIMTLAGCETVEGLGRDVESTGQVIQKTVRDARS